MMDDAFQSQGPAGSLGDNAVVKAFSEDSSTAARHKEDPTLVEHSGYGPGSTLCGKVGMRDEPEGQNLDNDQTRLTARHLAREFD